MFNVNSYHSQEVAQSVKIMPNETYVNNSNPPSHSCAQKKKKKILIFIFFGGKKGTRNTKFVIIKFSKPNLKHHRFPPLAFFQLIHHRILKPKVPRLMAMAAIGYLKCFLKGGDVDI
jgi:hypothetical protein